MYLVGIAFERRLQLQIKAVRQCTLKEFFYNSLVSFETILTKAIICFLVPESCVSLIESHRVSI